MVGNFTLVTGHLNITHNESHKRALTCKEPDVNPNREPTDGRNKVCMVIEHIFLLRYTVCNSLCIKKINLI